jgi:hypothetical protein
MNYKVSLLIICKYFITYKVSPNVGIEAHFSYVVLNSSQAEHEVCVSGE